MSQSKINKIIGCNLKYYMKKKGVTFVQLEELTGVSCKSLKRYSDGVTLPKLDKAFDIAYCLGVKIDQIWSVFKQWKVDKNVRSTLKNGKKLQIFVILLHF